MIVIDELLVYLIVFASGFSLALVETSTKQFGRFCLTKGSEIVTASEPDIAIKSDPVVSCSVPLKESH